MSRRGYYIGGHQVWYADGLSGKGRSKSRPKPKPLKYGHWFKGGGGGHDINVSSESFVHDYLRRVAKEKPKRKGKRP